MRKLLTLLTLIVFGFAANAYSASPPNKETYNITNAEGYNTHFGNMDPNKDGKVNWFRRALEDKRGIILVSAHLGNWEIGLQYLACHFGKRVHIVVRPLVPRWLDRRVNQARTRFGNHLISKRKAFPKMLKAIREEGIVALMVDLSSRKQSVAVDYFGHRTRVSPAAAMLAARCGAPIIAAFTFRNPDGSFTIEVSAPVAVRRSGSLKNDLTYNSQRITDIVEQAVRKHPDQYFWMQKRWKDYYPHLYPGYRPRSLPIGE